MVGVIVSEDDQRKAIVGLLLQILQLTNQNTGGMSDGLTVPGRENHPALPPVIAGADTPEIERRVENFFHSVASIFEAWVNRRKFDHTRRAYRGDVMAFVEFRKWAGKSFDWPLLETRYRTTRSIPLPALRAHLDFLHPARNLWRLRLGSVRLSQLERHLLGWDRGDDVVSEWIPRIYLDFVRHGNADPLVPVFQHNQMDLRGLADLSVRILALLGEESSSQDGLELYGVSRMCERRGEVKRARKLYEQSIASALPTETDRAARTALARLAKRDGDTDLARELWESTLGNSREGYKAYEQLAIHFEHKVRQPQYALGIVREALAEPGRANQASMISPAVYRRTKAEFEHRLARLERKAEQTQLEAFDA
jgi:hypothetical protein